MNLKQLKPKLNFIKNNHRPMLSNIKVTKGALKCTNLETYVTIKDNHGMREGLQAFNTLGLIDSDTTNVDDYPCNTVDIKHRDILLVELSQLERCLQFASKDETRLQLNGVAINSGHLVATDGHTLKSFKTELSSEHSYIMPSTSLKVLIKLLKGYKLKGLVRIELNESYATIDNSNFTLSMRLIAREYPKWQTIIPSKYEYTLDMIGFKMLMEYKALFKETRSHSCILKGSEGVILLTPKNYPNHNIIIGTCNHDFEIGFNFDYLVRAANKQDSFTIKYNNELGPVLVNDCIVMPLKL